MGNLNSFESENAFVSIDMKGIDAVDFGHRMLSQNIQKLKINESRLSLFLSAAGRVQSKFWVVRMPEGLRLLLPIREQKQAAALVEKYHFAETFTIELGSALKSYWTAEDHSSASEGTGELIEENVFRGYWRGTTYRVEFSSHDSLKDRAELEARSLAWLKHRILNLIPESNLDYNVDTLVFELGFESLCEEDKGCYIGQEVVERVRSRSGSGSRRLGLVSFPGDLGLTRDQIILDSTSNAVGSVAGSFAYFEDQNETLALVFLKRATKADLKLAEGRILKLCV